MDPTSQVVQTDQVQGDATNGAPYQEYLDRIPQELRGQVEPIFKDWDSQVTRRFQDHSAAIKQWEDQWGPYKQVGIDQWEPDSIAGLIEFSKLAQDPVQFRDWISGQARELGLLEAESEDLDFIDPSVQQLIERQMGPLQQELAQHRQWREQFESQQAQERAQGQIEQQLSALERQHGEIDREAVERFASKYHTQDPTNAVQRGFEDMQRYIAQVERNLLARKETQPETPQITGGPDPSAPRPSTLKDAERAMIERLQARAAM